MTDQELKNLKPWDFVYADKTGIITSFSRKKVSFKTCEVPHGCPGIIQTIGKDSMEILWDHYQFEDHSKQELLPNPITILNFTDLDLVRVNRFPPNFRYC